MHISGRRFALQQLKSVRSLIISRQKTSANVRYALEVVQTIPRRDSTSRIPTMSADCGASTLDDDTYSQSRAVRIERELHEFTTLRDNIYNTLRWAHRDNHCDFCGKMADLLVFGPNPDGLFLGLFGSKRASKTLQNFVTGILDLIAEYASSTSQCNCTGLSLVPEIVHTFLFDPVTNTFNTLVVL